MKASLVGYHVRVVDDAGDMICLLRLVGVPPDRDHKEVAGTLIRLINEQTIEPPLGKRVKA